MKPNNLRLVKWMAFFVLLISFVWMTGCSKDNSVVDPQGSIDQSTKAAMEKVAVSDETVASFEPNYNEEDVTGFVLGKVATQIYPVKVWQKMTRVSRNFDATYSGDTAYGKVTSNFEGTLYVAGSYTKSQSGSSVIIDTVISKQFSTSIVHNVILVKTASQDTSKDHWKVVAVSLPEGGTLTSNIQIQKMTLFLANGDTLNITSPNDYYLYKMTGKRRMIPSVSKGAALKVRVELTSAYADTDFVSVTHGAIYDSFMKGHYRVKTKFNLVSSTPEGASFRKVYEATIKTNQYMGYFHAVVNAIPRGVVMDDKAPVETNTWGIPYFVK